MRHWKVGIAAALLVAGAIGAWWWQTGTPEYSLAQLAAAIHSGARLRVEEYLDVHTVAETVVDQVVRAGMAESFKPSEGDNPFSALGTQLGMSLVQNMKPALTAQLEAAFWTMVDNDTAATSAPGRGGAAPSTLDPAKLKATYRGIATSEHLGSRARVSIRFAGTAPDTAPFNVPVRLERVGHHWRIVSVEIDERLLAGRSEGNSVDRAYVASMKSDLRNLVTAEEAYFADSVKYSSSVACALPPRPGKVAWCATTGNTLLGKPTIGTGTQAGWTVAIKNESTTKTCAIYVGAVSPAAPATTSDPEGAPVCRLATSQSADSLPSSNKPPLPKLPAPRTPAVGPRSAAAPHAGAKFEIVNVETKVTEQNDAYWRYAWRLTLKSMSADALVLSATIEFQDSDGFVIDTDQAYNLYLSPGEEKTFTGYALVSATTAANVAKTSAKVRSTF